MHILVPPLGSEPFKTPQRSSVVVDDLVADGTVLEVASRQADAPPLRFAFHGFTISDVGSNAPAAFKATLSNPEPPGEITTSGKFGPWNPDNVGKTAVSGDYRFETRTWARSRGSVECLLHRENMPARWSTLRFREKPTCHFSPLREARTANNSKLSFTPL